MWARSPKSQNSGDFRKGIAAVPFCGYHHGMDSDELRIGLALGGGGAAALSYIGVLEELDSAGVRLHCVAGTSAGAIVGAAYSAGKLAELREVLTSLTRGRMFTPFDPTWGRGGLIDGRRGMD